MLCHASVLCMLYRATALQTEKLTLTSACVCRPVKTMYTITREHLPADLQPHCTCEPSTCSSVSWPCGQAPEQHGHLCNVVPQMTPGILPSTAARSCVHCLSVSPRPQQSATMHCTFLSLCSVTPQYNAQKEAFGAWMWTSSIHAEYYTPMDFTQFPFDSQSLIIEVRSPGAPQSLVALQPQTAVPDLADTCSLCRGSSSVAPFMLANGPLYLRGAGLLLLPLHPSVLRTTSYGAVDDPRFHVDCRSSSTRTTRRS